MKYSAEILHLSAMRNIMVVSFDLPQGCNQQQSEPVKALPNDNIKEINKIVCGTPAAMTRPLANKYYIPGVWASRDQALFTVGINEDSIFYLHVLNLAGTISTSRPVKPGLSGSKIIPLLLYKFVFLL